MSDEPWRPPPPPEWSVNPAQPRDPESLKDRLRRFFAPLIAVGAFLAKFGVVIIKLKSVVFLGSAAVSIAAYAQLWGWKYAAGFVALLLIHELGHVVALRARGVRASAVAFLPFLGAFTSWEAQPRTPYEDAETALAGPVAGGVAALALGYWAHQADSGLMMSLAFTGLALTLFNLAPVRPLDGGRVVYLLNPWIWVLGILGLLGYELYRPGALALLLLVLAGIGLYVRVRDKQGRFARVAAMVTPIDRARISVAFLVLVAATLIGMHYTYVERHFS